VGWIHTGRRWWLGWRGPKYNNALGSGSRKRMLRVKIKRISFHNFFIWSGRIIEQSYIKLRREYYVFMARTTLVDPRLTQVGMYEMQMTSHCLRPYCVIDQKTWLRHLRKQKLDTALLKTGSIDQAAKPPFSLSPRLNELVEAA
jgi:hypothetical protein